MLSNKDLNKNKTFPLIKSQIPNNNSQIINCYINLTQNLNMNNHNCSLVTQIPLAKNSTNLTPEKLNPGQFNNTALLNTVINMNYLVQMQANYQHYSQLISNVNSTNLNQNEKKLKETPNMMGKKRSRKSKNDEIKINIKKTDKNIKNIIKEKNGTFDKNKIEGDMSKMDHSTDNEINETENEQNQPMEQQVKINIEKKSENAKNNSINKNKLNRKKKRNQYKELLQDTILEHLDCPKNEISIIINNSEYDETNNELKNKNVHKNENTKKNIKFRNDQKSFNLKKSNSIKRKTSNFNNRRYNRHFTQQKKSQKKKKTLHFKKNKNQFKKKIFFLSFLLIINLRITISLKFITNIIFPIHTPRKVTFNIIPSNSSPRISTFIPFPTIIPSTTSST